MSKGQSETRRSIRHIRQKPELRNDGTLKCADRFISRKTLYGNPEFMDGSNADRKRKTNKLEFKNKAKRRQNHV